MKIPVLEQIIFSLKPEDPKAKKHITVTVSAFPALLVFSWMRLVKVLDSFLASHFLDKHFVQTLLLTVVWHPFRRSCKQGLNVTGKLRKSWKFYPGYSSSWIICKAAGAMTVEKKIHRIVTKTNLQMKELTWTQVFGWTTSLSFQRSCRKISCLSSLIPGYAHNFFRDTREKFCNLSFSQPLYCYVL